MPPITTTLESLASALRSLADDVEPTPTDGVLEDLGVEWREDTAQDLRRWAALLVVADDNSPEARRARGLEPIRPAPNVQRVIDEGLTPGRDLQRAAAQDDPRGEADR